MGREKVDMQMKDIQGDSMMVMVVILTMVVVMAVRAANVYWVPTVCEALC